MKTKLGVIILSINWLPGQTAPNETNFQLPYSRFYHKQTRLQQTTPKAIQITIEMDLDIGGD